jgi:hypothetical protein
MPDQYDPYQSYGSYGAPPQQYSQAYSQVGAYQMPYGGYPQVGFGQGGAGAGGNYSYPIDPRLGGNAGSFMGGQQNSGFDSYEQNLYQVPINTQDPRDGARDPRDIYNPYSSSNNASQQDRQQGKH